MKKSLLFLSLIASISAANAQWTEQATGFFDAFRGLNQIQIVNSNVVWALAYDGSGGGANVQECTVTTDGGNLWTPNTIEMGNANLEINNISAVDGTTAWVSALVPTAGHGVIYKTTNGGANWTQQLSTGFQASASFLNGVYFFDANVGVAYGDPIGTGLGEFEVYRTTNGGANWTQVAASALPNPLSGEYGYNNTPVAVGNTLWFTTSKGRLYRTTDAGVTWTVAQAPLADFGGVDTVGTSGNVHFNNPGNTANGFLLRAVGTTTPVYTYWTTVDGGTTWIGGASGSAFTGTRYILNYIPGTTAIVATSQETGLSGTSISTNNGATWTNVESAEQRGAAAFLNASTGWCAGFSTDNITGGVYKLNTALANIDIQPTAKFKVYPNPATNVVTISTPDSETAKLAVTDLSGKVVMTKSLSGIENTVDISNLSTGAYFFEVSSNNNKEVIKILKN